MPDSFARFALLVFGALTLMGACVAAASSADNLSGASAEAVEVVRQRRAPGAARVPIPLESLVVERPASAGFAGQASLLLRSQVISFYGNPNSRAMGILGEAAPDEVIQRLKTQAERYDRINGPLGVTPALHLVYAVAQRHPGDGLYLQHVDDGTVRRYIDLAEAHGLLLFLDLQIGRSNVRDEFERVRAYLRHPNVHLALDPEFAVGYGEVPGRVLGSLDAADINDAQRALSTIVRTDGLRPKLLVVHRFADSMLPDADSIGSFPGVDVVIDSDGYGPAATKVATYERAAGSSDHAAGIKLFYRQDPDLMSETDVLALNPQPSIVIYQ